MNFVLGRDVYFFMSGRPESIRQRSSLHIQIQMAQLISKHETRQLTFRRLTVYISSA